MNWNNWSDFFAMGGYALYVWGSLLMTAVLLGAEVAALKLRRKTVIAQNRRWARNSRRQQ